MPMYMDIHEIRGATAEDIARRRTARMSKRSGSMASTNTKTGSR
jgi:hypothetical protein